MLDEPDPDSFFDATRTLLRSGDVVIGHVEVPHLVAERRILFRRAGATRRPRAPARARTGRGSAVASYIEEITARAGLRCRFRCDEGMVWFEPYL